MSKPLAAYCKHGNSYCILCFAEFKSHSTQQPVKKFEERSRDLGNESAESGAKTDPEPKGTCSKHVGLHVNIEELCEEWHEERGNTQEFESALKAIIHGSLAAEEMSSPCHICRPSDEHRHEEGCPILLAERLFGSD